VEPVSFSIRRESVNTGNVSYSGIISNDVIYIKLDRFMEDAAKQVKTALTQLKNQQKISGIILDLRGNGGGILAEAVKISNLFIKQGTLIVSQKGQRKKNNADYVATNPPIDTETPLVVLVDQGSASASEVVTGAIQDTDRGIIIGQRTFGKGLVQNTVQIAYNSLLKLTIAKYYTPSGRCIQALDYTHRRSDGSVEKVADSLISEFKTSNGRLVYDGSGIFPDIEITSKDAPAVARALHEKYLFFKFANEFHFKNKSIPSATEFALNDAQYKSFIDFVRDEKFEYTTETEEKIRNLREAMDKDLIKESGKLSDALLGKIKDIKETELIRNKKLISEILEAEIALRYYFQKGRIESTFDDDEEIAQAIKRIRNPDLIKDILTGKGEFKTIGKPKAIEKSVEAAVMESPEGEQ
jgi:carboxyl-terminal processing protease